jgi:hypothetical protein
MNFSGSHVCAKHMHMPKHVMHVMHGLLPSSDHR